MRDGTVYQRHLRSCPRNPDGSWARHKCRGRWSYTVDGGRDPMTGRRRQLTRGGFATRGEAKTALRELLTRLDHGGAEGHGLTVGAFLTTWLAGKRALRPTTAEAYRSHVELYLLPQLGRIRLADLRASHLDAAFATIAGGTRKPLSAATVRRVHATLRNALNAAVRQRLIAYNPADQIELAPARRPETTVWTPEQLGQFLDQVAGDRLAALWHLMAMTGLRRGEAAGLRWVDLDLDTGTLRVAQQVTVVKMKLVYGPPKTKSGSRTVPLDPQTVAVLRAHRTRQLEERLAWGSAWADTGLVFTRDHGSPLDPEQHLTRGFVAAARRAGLPVIKLHALRHTSASLALAAGVPMRVVSERLGHSTTGITADLYSHVSPAVARDAADRIAAIVPRARSS